MIEYVEMKENVKRCSSLDISVMSILQIQPGSLLTSFKFLYSFRKSFMKVFSKEITKFTMFISSLKMLLKYHPYNLKRGLMY